MTKTISLLLCATLLIFPFQTSEAQGPATVIVAGITTSALLDKLSDKANNIVQNAGAVGSLLASKAARDVQLEIMAARIQLHDELNQNWDRLDQQKVSVLKEIDSSLTQISTDLGRVSQMQDDLVLDVDGILNRIPFLKDVKTIRRIWGASQYYRPNGIYIVTLHGNIFDSGAGAPDVTIGGRHLSTPPIVQPPYDVRLEIPANMLNDRFQDRKITQVPVVVKQRVYARDYALQFWRDEYKTQEYDFTLELFPKYPAAYRLTEFDSVPDFDQNQTLTWPRREYLIPGCGHEGCNDYHQIAEDLPPNNQPVSPQAWTNFYDSRGLNWFSGFGPCHNTSTGAICTYWQHSHNTARNVGFDVLYHPPTTVIVQRDVELVPISGESLSHYFDDPQADDAGQAKDAKTSSATTGTQQIAEKGIDHGAVRIGQTYDIRFNNSMKSFTLVFRTFTGEEIVVTPGKASPDQLDLSQLENQTDFKRITVAFKPPW